MKRHIFILLFWCINTTIIAQTKSTFEIATGEEDITAVAFSLNNELILAASWDGALYVYRNDSTMELISTFNNHKGAITSLSVSRDGKYVITGGQDGIINKYIVFSANESFFPVDFDTAYKFIQGTQINKVEYGINLRTIFVADNKGMLHAFDLDKKKLRSFNHNQPINTFAVSIDMRKIYIAGVNESNITEYDGFGKVQRTFSGHTDVINDIVVSLDGKSIVSASSDKSIIVWNTGNAKIEKTFLGHEWKVTDIALDPRGNLLLSGGLEGVSFLWELKTGVVLDTFSVNNARCNAVALAPNNKTILAAFHVENQSKQGFKVYGTKLKKLPSKTADVKSKEVNSKTSKSVAKNEKAGPKKENNTKPEKVVQKTEQLEIRVEE